MCVRIGSFSFPRFLVSYDKGEGREEGEWIGIIGIESFFFLFFLSFFLIGDDNVQNSFDVQACLFLSYIYRSQPTWSSG